jgi:hypothetical protein
MRATVLVVLLATIVACAKDEPRAPTEAETDLARSAAKEMMTRLLGELQNAVGDSGHAAAISVCRDVAPRIAREVGREYGLTVGRTSHRLRNPLNAPPEWAKDIVARAKTSPAGEWKGPEAVVSSDGSFGILLPIPMKPMCVVCHGSAGDIAEDVRAALAEQYPEDAATEFRPGELRGFVWVEWKSPE